VPFLDEDIPLYVDPFLLWKSPSLQDKSLHLSAVNAFNHLGYLVNIGKLARAQELLIQASECDDIGLGFSTTRKGRRLTKTQANAVLEVFSRIPAIVKHGFTHIETIQLLVDGIAKDRISDIFCSYTKSFLIDYTAEVSTQIGLPLTDVSVSGVYNPSTHDFGNVSANLPVHPDTKQPILLVPKRWLRRIPWIGMEQYIELYYKQEIAKSEADIPARMKVVLHNRDNFGVIESFVSQRELQHADCLSDPLFAQIPVLSMKRHHAAIQKILAGKTDGADKKYEDAVIAMLASAFYPALDFAQDQVRTDSGAHIRDMIFYNTQSTIFLRELASTYKTRQIVVELKNVRELSAEHVNQLNRYLAHDFGNFGVIVTRNPVPKNVARNIIDLWSAHRKTVVVLTDQDLGQIAEMFESKSRPPIDVLNAAYVRHARVRPS